MPVAYIELIGFPTIEFVVYNGIKYINTAFEG